MSELIEAISGRWSGRKSLFLSWLPHPEQLSDSSLRATGVVNAHALELRYDWSYEDQPRHGLLLLVLRPGSSQVSGGWMDSWHQGNALMPLSGSYDQQCIDLLGHYPVEGSADWGWRMLLELDLASDTLSLQMFNRAPEGVDELAVKLLWQRRAD